jgi:recombination protein RecR
LSYTPALSRLIELLAKLPGIGEKTAARLAFFILRGESSYAHDLGRAIAEVKDSTKFCETCYGLSEAPQCGICADSRRDPSVICIVEEPSDVVAVERTHDFKGLYHVLHGAISPLDGRGPEQLRIAEMVRRLESGVVTEVVVATNPTVEGEATAVYLARLIKPLGVTVSRIAHGIPMGGNLEYTDQVTIGRALEGRRRM